MDRLEYSKIKQLTMATDVLDAPAQAQLLRDYQAAEQRLLLLDYDGTLVGFQTNPQRAEPDAELLELLELLGALAANPRNWVVISSGRDRATLQKWLGALPLDFIAEHGLWLRQAGGEWHLFQEELRNDWKREFRPVLEQYVRRTAGSAIEEKDYSLVWHCRRADAGLGDVRARELLSHLSFMTSNTGLQVLEGNRVLEIRNAGLNKGTAAARWLTLDHPGFVLALGDDRTDEDTFGALPPEAYTVKVGSVPRSLARYSVAGPADVRRLLRSLRKGG